MTDASVIETNSARLSGLRNDPGLKPEPATLSFNDFQRRHIGPSHEEAGQMLKFLGFESLNDLVAAAVPSQIRSSGPLDLPAARTESQALSSLREIASQNQVFRSYIGMGYHDCITPPVIQRVLFENPGWYTQYTPYQAEISQGRLEALLSFQTMVIDLTGLEVANASLLDEATAAAEAMALCHAVKEGRSVFFVSTECHPQTIDVVKTRAKALGIQVVCGNHASYEFTEQVCGALLQYQAPIERSRIIRSSSKTLTLPAPSSP